MKLTAELLPHEKGFDAWLRQQNHVVAKLLLNPDPNAQTQESDARRFEDTILGELKPTGENKSTIIAWLRIAYQRISYLNAQNLAKIHPIRLAVDIPPPRSPFIVERTMLIERAEKWREALFSWLKTHGATATAEQLRSAAMLSSALCGCLLDPRKILGLHHIFGRPLKRSGTLAYVEFALPYRNLTGNLNQRWFPDPITEMLIVRGIDPLGQFAPSSNRNIFNHLRQFMKAMGISKDLLPGSLAALTETSSIYWESRGTQVDIRYARNRFISQSLKSEVWLRLNRRDDQKPEAFLSASHPSTTSLGVEVRDDTVLGNDSDEIHAVQDDQNSLITWWPEFLDKLNSIPTVGQSRADVKVSCEAFLSTLNWDLPTYFKIYTEWLLAMLDGASSSGNPLQPETILGYFKHVTPAMLSVFGTQDLDVNVAAERVVESYGTILELIPTGIRRVTLAKGMRELHEHLVRHYQFDPVDPVDTFGKEAEVAVVEARIISVDEYYRADLVLKEYVFQQISPHLISVARLVLTLAFRTGMRRMEIFMLRLSDIHLEKSGDILVRPHAQRRLKSISSRRRIPICALMEPDELDRLNRWITQRKSKPGNENSELLFALPTGDMVSVEGVVDLIHRALREVTGERDLHLHHLRHSFATWTYLKLRSVAYPKLADLFQHLPKTHVYLSKPQELRNQLIPGKHSIPSRSDAYCVSRLLGHSGPNISLNHYIHSTDLLIYGMTCRNAEQIEGPVLIGASGLPVRSGFRYLTKSKSCLMDKFRAKNFGQYILDPLSAPSKKNAHSKDSTTVRSQSSTDSTFAFGQYIIKDIESAWRVLRLHDDGADTSTIVREQGLQESEVTRIIDAAGPIAQKIGLSKVLKNFVRQLAPPLPEGEREKLFHANLLSALSHLKTGDPDLLAEGLSIHLDNFSTHKRDVIFRNPEDATHALKYLKFLQKIGFGPESIQIISRAKPGEVNSLNRWIKALVLPHTIRIKHIAPPNITKTAYEKWIGIQVVDPRTGRGNHLLLAGDMMLARLVT
jgi:integrase